MTTGRLTVLVVEDEKLIRRFLRSALEEEGCTVCEADGVGRGLTEAGACKPALVVLDLGLPDGDGVDFIHNFRAWSEAPILVLSARSNEQDKVRALDAGADDYLTKPFGVGELRARARALLRRHGRHGDAVDPVVEFGSVRVDLSQRSVLRNGEPVHLTPIEYRLLRVLLANSGKVMTQRHLLREVWGGDRVEHSPYLRVYVGHLRQKLEEDPTQPTYLLTETGVGYRFQPPVAALESS
ncbi:two-component system response regulator KdpE [Propionivibrio dicarboxylicus]|uniref:Two-component system, OmpR family, KDP operon response regulator KdpE n=1 Tax=Propionivibrio dicarboxylicus TaxID=83767 RepID=A0A1G7V0I7_9RHOO|nr:two-component system response regulator KdpE [Propionivibrio dicarboxylicus]SDG53267.1 two-component system, OmpR family, KDP operon response regulator KdpE [Propionivibrio dicarboxylicus]